MFLEAWTPAAFVQLISIPNKDNDDNCNNYGDRSIDIKKCHIDDNYDEDNDNDDYCDSCDNAKLINISNGNNYDKWR